LALFTFKQDFELTILVMIKFI